MRDKSQESSVNPDPDKVGTGLIGVKETVIIGNGDVISYQDGLVKAKTSGVDGIMIGRGVFQNIFVFLLYCLLAYPRNNLFPEPILFLLLILDFLFY